MKHHPGGIESPVSLFFLSLFSLCIGGVITWYLFARDVPGSTGRGTAKEGTTVSEPQGGSLVAMVPEKTRTEDPSGHATGSVADSRRDAIVMAAERVGPSVVSINVLQTQVVTARNPYNFDDFWNDFFFPRSYKREVQSLGSGFIVSAQGHILTNEHVVRGAEEITVILEDGREFKASVLGADKQTDLAVLDIDAKDLPISPLGTSGDLLIGEWVIAIGNPFGYLLDDTQPTVTVGVVSAVKRDLKVTKSEETTYSDMIQTDASINPGNSGGPLVNSRGEVVGVNTFIFTKSGGSLGMGFAIPIDRAERVYQEILRYGRVQQPWIGIHPQDLTPALKRGLNLEEGNWRGIVVSDVDNGSPSQIAGIKRGDVISRIDGKPIRSAQDWQGILLDVPVDEEVTLEVYRDGSPATVRLTTVPLPTDAAERVEVDFGVVLTDVTDAIRSQLGLRSNRGALILEVKDAQLSTDSGLEPYDVILKVNESDIDSAKKAKKALENLSQRRNSIVLERDGRLIYRSLLIG